MALRENVENLEEIEAATKRVEERFSRARENSERELLGQDSNPSDKQLEVWGGVEHLIQSLAFGLELEVKDSLEKAVALQKLEVALKWSGEAIFNG